MGSVHVDNPDMWITCINAPKRAFVGPDLVGRDYVGSSSNRSRHMLEKIRKWYEGDYIAYRNDLDSPVFFVGGY